MDNQGNWFATKCVLAAASALVLARLIAPFEIGRDQAYQIEATHRLVAGLGLTSTGNTSVSFADYPPALSRSYAAGAMTWWAPGLSLLLAGPLALGLGLAASLKLVYGAVTLAGWVGWSLVAGFCVPREATAGKRSRVVHALILAAIPLATTPLWSGTDIFLWAALPLVVMLIANVPADSALPSPATALLVGLICGGVYAFRYAGVFLAFGAGLLVLILGAPAWKTVFGRLVALGIGAASIALPVLYFVKSHSASDSVLPEFVGITSEAGSPFATLVASLRYLSAALVGPSDSIVEQVLVLVNKNALRIAVGAFSAAIVAALPVYLMPRRGGETAGRTGERVLFGLSVMPLVLAVFLVAMDFAIDAPDFSPIEQARYYEPVHLCGIFIFYHLTMQKGRPRAVRVLASLLFATFLIYPLAYLPVRALRPRTYPLVVRHVLGFRPRAGGGASTSVAIPYPGNRVYTQKEGTRERMRALHRSRPDALFLVFDVYALYVYDRLPAPTPLAGELVRFAPPPGHTYWDTAFADRDLLVYWVYDPTDPEIQRAIDTIAGGKPRIIHEDPYERTTIAASELSSGHRLRSVVGTSRQLRPDPAQPSGGPSRSQPAPADGGTAGTAAPTDAAPDAPRSSKN